MKTTSEYIETLRQHAPILRERFGMTSMQLFGLSDLRCQNGISSWGGDRRLPHAFTEEGVASTP